MVEEMVEQSCSPSESQKAKRERERDWGPTIFFKGMLSKT
jgi:hypothetical protein